MRKVYWVGAIGVIAALVLALYFFASRQENPTPTSPKPSSVSTSTPDATDIIHVFSPHPGGTVSSPMKVQGVARGFWYFEASFPLRVEDSSGRVLGSGIAQARGEWMTTEFVPFNTLLAFSESETKKGVLVLEKDNPSGLPEHAASLRIPVTFAPRAPIQKKVPPVPQKNPAQKQSTTECRAGGCSGQICSDQVGMITTCEYRPEYACYAHAKCERQVDGVCGWTMDAALARCLRTSRG